MKKTRKNHLLQALGIAAILISLAGLIVAAELQAIKLNPQNLKRGLPLMEAL